MQVFNNLTYQMYKHYINSGTTQEFAYRRAKELKKSNIIGNHGK